MDRESSTGTGERDEIEVVPDVEVAHDEETATGEVVLDEAPAEPKKRAAPPPPPPSPRSRELSIEERHALLAVLRDVARPD